MRKSFLFVLAFLTGSTLMAHATQAESMNCDDDDRPPSTHNYSGNPSDVLQPRHRAPSPATEDLKFMSATLTSVCVQRET
jgi:hypothetical protein